MAERWDLDRLAAEWTARGLDRRQLMKLIGAGAGATALTTLMTTPRAGAQDTGVDSQVSILWRTPTTLSPLFSTAGSEQQVERLIFGALVKMTADLDQVADMASEIEVSDDATTYTFTLADGTTFNDGTPLTSDDVVFTIERAVDARTASYWRGRLLGIDGAAAYGDQEAESITGLEAPDERTIKITLENPDSAFLVNFVDFSGFGILPKHILEDIEPDQLINHPFNLEPTVGAGAYNFARYESDQFLELERNETYWGEQPAIERIFLRILQPEIAVADLEQGNLDMMPIGIDDIARLTENPNLTVVSVPSPSLDTISVNLDREYFQDKRIRQAMMYALDRETIVQEIYQGQAQVMNSPIFGPDWMGIPDGLNEYPYDPDQARQLLEEAGWDSSRTVELMYVPGGNATFDSMVPIVQAQFADVGIQVELLQLESPELIRKLVTEPDYDMYIGGGGVYGADPSICSKYYIEKNLTPAGANNTRYVNPELDEMFDQGRVASDQDDRRAIYTRIAQILNDDLPSIFLWSPNTNFASSTRLQGFEPPRYVNNQLWNAEEWSLVQP
jgi:peptide/nickel transport system substrate-binding protein